MEIEVKAPAIVVQGQHIGVITKVDYRTEPFNYTDVYVETKDAEGNIVELKYGCPTKITPVTKLGRLLKQFGADVKPNTKIDPDKFLIGKKVVFMTMNKTTDKGTFSNIVVDSLKPIEGENTSPSFHSDVS